LAAESIRRTTAAMKKEMAGEDLTGLEQLLVNSPQI
jgi:hypothetical protein